MTGSMHSGFHSSAAGRALLGLTWLTLAGIIGAVWLTFGEFLSRYQACQASGQPNSANLQRIKVGILLQS